MRVANQTRPARGGALWAMGAALLALLVVGVALSGAPPIFAQRADESAAGELATRVARRFDVLTLSDGVVLRPRFPAEYGAVEISGGSVAVDGDRLAGDALRDRLDDDDDFDVVTALVALDSKSRREVLAAAAGAATQSPSNGAGAATTLPRPPAPPAAPAAPATPEPPAAPDVPEAPEPPRKPMHSDAEVAVGSHVVIEEDETSDDVVVFGGTINVLGEVDGDAVAMGGSIKVNGRVTGDVVAVGGSVELGPKARVEGEVTSVGGKVDKDPAAEVDGKITETKLGPGFRSLRALRHLEDKGQDDWSNAWNFSPFSRLTEVIWGLMKIGLLGLLACLALLLARPSVERIGALAIAETWKAGLTGLVTQILFVPVLVITVVVLAISIVGIPLLLLVPFAIVGLVIAAFVGYAAVGHRLGRWVEGRMGWAHRSDMQSLLIGVLAIEVWRVVADLLDWGPLGFASFILTCLGFLVTYVAWTVGFGAMLLTVFGEGGPLARRRAARVAARTPAPNPPPAAAPAPVFEETQVDETEPQGELSDGQDEDGEGDKGPREI